MIGHGGPRTARRYVALQGRNVNRWGCRLLLAAFLAFWVYGTTVAAETLRVRVSWGGGAERLWHGVIGVSEGTVAEPNPLGIEADEPGSMWLEEGYLVIRQRSPRTFDGVDLSVSAPREAKLFVQLTPTDAQPQPKQIEVPLASLFDELFHADLDDRDNRLIVDRTPDDAIKVKLNRDSLVFSPGESFKFELQPHRLPVEPGSKLRIKVELHQARTTNKLQSTEHAVVAGELAPIREEIRLPDEEGVYDVVITASQTAWLRLPQPGQSPLNRNKTVAQRKIQLVVLSPQQPEVPVGVGQGLSVVEEIDPANPKWWERFSNVSQLPHLKRFWKGPLGNGYSHTWQHPLGELVRLEPGPDGSDVSWEAYTLPIKQPGLPHVLEFDYPGDVSQMTGISIIETNAAGAVFPIGLDSGLELADEVGTPQGSPKRLRHRVIFWPRTKAPLVLITNRRHDSPAVYGKIRVLAGWKHLPRAFPVGGRPPERLAAAYLDRPLFPENFSANEALGSLSDLGVDDWVTFYQGGTRLVEYLNHVGFGGLMISVFADGSTIYPSRLLQPTPRYDTGVFLDAGQDPVRKDVLEMLLRLFDRDGLQLIPALEFGSPLPELEAILRRGGPESAGIQWIGKEGTAWVEAYELRRGKAAYYNVLHPRVQEAMLSVIRELVQRYGHHASFAGLALQLSAHGYAQLPGPGWGIDDFTVGRFEQDMNVQVPGEGPNRFAQRARFLDAAPPSQEWLQWRAQQLSRFYHRIQAELNAVRPDARLYLAGANMFTGDELESVLRPTLPQRTTFSEAMLRVGIDLEHYGQNSGLVLLRSQRFAPRWSLPQQAVNLEIERMFDTDGVNDAFRELSIPGSLFFHQPQEVRVASFDAKSPFQSSYTRLATQVVPSAAQNRRRFVHSLAMLDSQVMFDGSQQLLLGQEDSIRELIAVYRQLPAIRFRSLSEQPGSASIQPVTIRYGSRNDGTYVYVLNDAPFAATARIRVSAPRGCRVEELSGLRQVNPLRADGDGVFWSIDLRSYDLVGVRLSDPNVKLSKPQVSWAEEVRKTLQARIDELGDRTAALRNPPSLDDLENPGFERPMDPNGQIAGWTVKQPAGVTVELDTNQKHDGNHAVRMFSGGPTASLVSQPFDPLPTGRLTIWVWVRVAAATPQAPLQLTLQAKRHNGEDYFQYAPIGRPGEWQSFVVPVNDLPLEGLSQLRVRFDLMGPGEVWIDDVQLWSLDFISRGELIDLLKLISPAEHSLNNGQVSDCIQLLEGYWPRFLMANVPSPEFSVTQKTGPSLRKEPGKKLDKPAGFFGRMKSLLPKKLRF